MNKRTTMSRIAHIADNVAVRPGPLTAIRNGKLRRRDGAQPAELLPRATSAKGLHLLRLAVVRHEGGVRSG